ncbi:MAG: peptide chain release factor N(5)-glutamine methyltransferase [Firmicutes bacterium]|nr:peptide chain release factor N(5)-glutamine methyltransferase [Bacillota bacterium]
MKTRILIKEGEYRLAKAYVMDPKVDAEELYSFLTGVDRVAIFMDAEKEVDKETEEKYFQLIEKRATRVPLQHITGHQSFMGYDFKVNDKVLIPRQDTETLVTEAARAIQSTERPKLGLMDRLKGRKEWEVLDLCCGSGCVGISLAKICSNIEVTASDVSAEALEVARENASELRVKIDFKQGHMFLPHKGRKFDMIVCNPPYIRRAIIEILQEEVKDYEPRVALDGGRDGLDFYRLIVDQAADYLKTNGFLLMEIGHDQGEALRKMLKDSGKYTPAEVIRDLPGKDRVVKCMIK